VYDTRDICDGHQWDQNELDLPSEFTIELVGDNDVENEIADTISDLTGWCVGSYNYEIL
jgi:hypothetical protein